jgi:PAS domain S-box-containing protein
MYMLARRRAHLCLVWIFQVAALLLVVLPASADTTPLPPAERIVVAFPEALPPYVIIDETRAITGQRADVWALWSERTGIPVTLRHVPWADLEAALASGDVTVADGVTPTSFRDSWLDLAPSYAAISIALFYDTHVPPLTDLSSLGAAVVGTAKNGLCEAVLLAEGIPLITYPLLSDLMVAARRGNPHVFCLPTALGDDIFAESGLALHFVHTPPIRQTTAHWAVAKGDTETFQMIAAGFDKITPDDLTAISDTWLYEKTPALLTYSTAQVLQILQILALMVLAGLVSALVLRWRLGRALAARSAVADTLRQRIREQTCLHSVFAATEDMTRPRADILCDVARALTDGWHTASNARFRITLGGVTHDDIPEQFDGPLLTVPIDIDDQHFGTITVAILPAETKAKGTPPPPVSVLPEQQLLVELVASRLAGRMLATQTVDRLMKSEERFRHTFQHSAQATAVIRNGVFVDANAASLAMLGYPTGSSFIGLRPSEFSPLRQPDRKLSAEKEVVLLERLVQRGSLKFEWEHLKFDGTPVLIEVMLTAVQQDDHLDVFVLWHDITVKRDAEIALAEYQGTLEAQVAKRTDDLVKLNDQLQAIFATANSGIALVRNRVIEACNPSLSSLLMQPQDRLLGASTRQFFSNDDLWEDLGASVYAELAQGKTVVLENEVVRGDGTTVLVSIRATAIDPRDVEKGIVYVMQDISQERAASEKLAYLRDLAEQSLQLKSEFLAHISHELRSPINAVLGFTELLLGSALTDEQQNFAQKAQASGRHLLMIINDILDLSKVEAGKLRIEATEFQLSKVLKSAIDSVATGAADKDIELIVTIDKAVAPQLIGDPLRLTQILMNYLSNALKFTKSGEIVLAVAPDPQASAPHSLRFSVTDTGIGLSPDQLSRLFQSFSQAEDSTARLYGGSGLGLAICQQLASLMGGEVGVSSAPGEGSTFWVTLPLSPATVPTRRPRRHFPLRGRHVAVVDDNPRAAEMASSILLDAGAKVTTLPSGPALIDAIAAATTEGKTIDVAIIDSTMPDVSGLDCPPLLREAGLPVPKLVLMSKKGGQDVVETALRTGFDDLVTKPIEPAVVVDRIATLLQRNKDQRRPALPPALPPANAPLPPFHGRHALVVDDNLMNLELAAAMLTRQGLTVVTATNGAEALQALLDHAIDLVLMDSQMPVMGGLEATRRIRALPTGKATIPIIGLTGKSEDIDRAEALAVGMNDYLVKPVSPSQLKLLLETYLPAAVPASA